MKTITNIKKMKLYFSFFILGVLNQVATAAVDAATVVSDNDIVTFPTPLEELDRIQKECEEKGVHGIEKSRLIHRNCLAAVNITEENGGFGKLNCDNLETRNSCWKSIVEIIDKCNPQRGTTVLKIYSAFAQVTCETRDEFIRLTKSGKVCSTQSMKISACFSSDLTSSDLCISFNAQRDCEEADIAPCVHLEHKRLVMAYFEGVEKSINCPTPNVNDTQKCKNLDNINCPNVTDTQKFKNLDNINCPNVTVTQKCKNVDDINCPNVIDTQKCKNLENRPLPLTSLILFTKIITLSYTL